MSMICIHMISISVISASFDCLRIDGTIFSHVLRTLQETLRFFELYLPGVRQVPKKERKEATGPLRGLEVAVSRPDPIEYWKEVSW